VLCCIVLCNVFPAGESEDDVINPEAPFVLATSAEAFARNTVQLYTDNNLWRQVC
jgi:hypothetical protein